MKLQALVFFALSIITANQLFAQNLPFPTIWEGKLSGIRIILKLSEDSITKQRIGEFDSPDQGAFGLKISELKITQDSVLAISSQIGGGFLGAFNADKTELVGDWKQGGGAFPLILKKVDQLAELVRPQTPKAPFPYSEKKVIYYNKDKSIQYGATLTLPDTNKNVPVVILITGSGQQDRDETLFGHKPFWVIADHLSRNGIAVLRVDDRGVGETTGEVMTATSLDFASDVLVGIEFLKAQKGIDVNKIGLLGHSEGGVIAPLAAIQSTDVAFIVSLAGVGIKGSELMERQLHASYRSMGLNDEEIASLDSLTQMMVDIGDRFSEKDDRRYEFQKGMYAWLESKPEPFLLKTGFKGPNADRTIDQMAGRLFLPWMRYFLKYDPETTLAKIKIPVLALNGEKDIQVAAKENLAGFDKFLTQAGNKNFRTISFPNLNHFFQHAETGAVSEYASIEETISPEVLNIIREWIKGL